VDPHWKLPAVLKLVDLGLSKAGSFDDLTQAEHTRGGIVGFGARAWRQYCRVIDPMNFGMYRILEVNQISCIRVSHHCRDLAEMEGRKVKMLAQLNANDHYEFDAN
jgi:hypothetical protein